MRLAILCALLAVACSNGRQRPPCGGSCPSDRPIFHCERDDGRICENDALENPLTGSTCDDQGQRCQFADGTTVRAVCLSEAEDMSLGVGRTLPDGGVGALPRCADVGDGG